MDGLAFHETTQPRTSVVVTVTCRPTSADLKVAFARNLKSAREAAGMSQRELAKQAGVSRSYLWGVERATANVTLDMVTLLARVIGSEPHDLLRPPDLPTRSPTPPVRK